MTRNRAYPRVTKRRFYKGRRSSPGGSEGSNPSHSARLFLAPLLGVLLLHLSPVRGADLDPVTRTTGAIRRVRALRHDSFQAELARRLVEARSHFANVLHGANALRIAKYVLESRLSLHQRELPDVLRAQRKNVEGANRCRL